MSFGAFGRFFKAVHGSQRSLEQQSAGGKMTPSL
jgi:hypothetical protein